MTLSHSSPARFPGSLLCAAMVFLAMLGHANAWWNDDFTLRKKITVDAASVGAADPLGSPVVLVRLHDGNFQFAAAKEDGSDVRFVAGDDKTPLAFHFEKFDSLMSEAYAWVRIPDLKSGTPATIWMYYGNSGNKTAPGALDEKATYGSGAVLVYHFAEHGAPAHDASGHGNNAQEAALPAAGTLIGSGARLNGEKEVTIPASASLNETAGSAMTWSAWVKPASLQANGILFSRGGTGGFAVGVDNGAPFVEVGGQRSGAGKPIAAGGWHHLAVVAEPAKTTLYLDGEAYSGVGSGLPALDGPLTLGGKFQGDIDELEIEGAARSPGAVKLAAAIQGSDAAMAGKALAFGGDEQAASWMSGTLGILLKSLTIDGWIVICILVVMGTVSWIVMIGKVGYLNGISRGNALFMKEWRHVAADLTVLDHGEVESAKTLGGRLDKKAEASIRFSSAYRIYQIGAEEIRHRVAPGAQGELRVLSAQSIQAIKATLDTGLVHEMQRLSRLMVMLTIAISGGPFLGLLGTVVGVMITFAAIAQAGDVNVNSIAPGIAAALVATVAGLAVAIPALFGYNYLISRIKNATSDMQVFVDEFVTKMAEFYRPRPEANPKASSIDLDELVRRLTIANRPAADGRVAEEARR
jgi:biopolymer transport protein ExbB